jgi:hypothetical protein
MRSSFLVAQRFHTYLFGYSRILPTIVRRFQIILRNFTSQTGMLGDLLSGIQPEENSPLLYQNREQVIAHVPRSHRSRLQRLSMQLKHTCCLPVCLLRLPEVGNGTEPEYLPRLDGPIVSFWIHTCCISVQSSNIKIEPTPKIMHMPSTLTLTCAVERIFWRWQIFISCGSVVMLICVKELIPGRISKFSGDENSLIRRCRTASDRLCRLCASCTHWSSGSGDEVVDFIVKTKSCASSRALSIIVVAHCRTIDHAAFHTMRKMAACCGESWRSPFSTVLNAA